MPSLFLVTMLAAYVPAESGSDCADTGAAIRVATHFGMHVRYFSRTPKPHLESETLQYTALDALLGWADVISIHVHKHTQVLDAASFSLMRPGAVIINTSLGPTFDIASFLRWVE